MSGRGLGGGWLRLGVENRREQRNRQGIKLMTKGGSEAKTRPMAKFFVYPAFLPNTAAYNPTKADEFLDEFPGLHLSPEMLCIFRAKNKDANTRVHAGNNGSGNKGYVTIGKHPTGRKRGGRRDFEVAIML